MVNAWNVGELDQMVLPPCHYGFQIYTRELNLKERYHIWFTNNYESGMEYCEEIIPNFDDPYYVPTPTRSISLMWNQRSADLFLGLPFNIASYGLLLHILGSIVNMVPDELVGNLGDVHLYENHLSQSTEQLRREPLQLPKLVHMKTDEFYKSLSEDTSLFFHLKNTDFVVENYQSHPTIKAPLSN
jgi:thymidylate synthase